MNRSEYYSQTEVLKKFKVSAKQYKELIQHHQLQQVNRQVDFGTYQLTTIYIKKEDVEKLNLPSK